MTTQTYAEVVAQEEEEARQLEGMASVDESTLELCKEYLALNREESKIKTKKEALKKKLRNVLTEKDAAILVFDEEPIVELVTTSTETWMKEELKRDFPEIVALYTYQKKGDRLDVKK